MPCKRAAMKILVTGSAGHLGEALIRSMKSKDDELIGIDIRTSAYTMHVGSISDRGFVRRCMTGVDAVLHTATLHKPHIATHTRQDFIDTNVTGTLVLLEEAVSAGVKTFIHSSTTSTFGDAMRPATGEPAVWVTEELQPKPKNIYGVTKIAAEDLCMLINRNLGLPSIILRISRFFPELDDNQGKRESYSNDNLKANELLFRRVDIQDVVKAHRLAIDRAQEIGFDRFIISATTPFKRSDAIELGTDAPSVLERRVPNYLQEYVRRGWTMFPFIGRVYDNAHARNKLDWTPDYDFHRVIERLSKGEHYQSPLSREVGIKGYHETSFADGPYPVD